MVLILKPNYRVAVRDGETHFLAEPPTLGTVEILRDLLGWSAYYDAHTMTVELHSPDETCGLQGWAQAKTGGGGDAKTNQATAP